MTEAKTWENVSDLCSDYTEKLILSVIRNGEHLSVYIENPNEFNQALDRLEGACGKVSEDERAMLEDKVLSWELPV